MLEDLIPKDESCSQDTKIVQSTIRDMGFNEWKHNQVGASRRRCVRLAYYIHPSLHPHNFFALSRPWSIVRFREKKKKNTGTFPRLRVAQSLEKGCFVLNCRLSVVTMSYSYEVERRSTPMMVGAVVGAMCIAGVVGFLASSSATSLHTASPVATRVAGRTVAPATMPVARAPAALTAAPYGVEAEVEEAARPVGYAYETPAQTHSWTTVLAGVLAVPLAALGLNSLTKKGTAKAKSRGLLVNIDDLVTVGKQAAVAGAAAAALAGPAAAYPIFAQQGYANPREATGRLVCANCHLAQKETEIELPQAVLPDQVFEAVAKVPTLGADVSKSVDASAFLAPVCSAGGRSCHGARAVQQLPPGRVLAGTGCSFPCLTFRRHPARPASTDPFRAEAPDPQGPDQKLPQTFCSSNSPAKGSLRRWL